MQHLCILRLTGMRTPPSKNPAMIKGHADINERIVLSLDINECSSRSVINYCHSKASCTNTYGSYLCTCNRGYTGYGTFCQGR